MPTNRTAINWRTAARAKILLAWAGIFRHDMMALAPRSDDWWADRWQQDAEQTILAGCKRFCKLVLTTYGWPAHWAAELNPFWEMLSRVRARELGEELRLIRAGKGTSWGMRRVTCADTAIAILHEISHLIHQKLKPSDWVEVYYCENKDALSPHFHGLSRSPSENTFSCDLSSFGFDKRPSYASRLKWELLAGECYGKQGPAFLGDVSVLVAQKIKVFPL